MYVNIQIYCCSYQHACYKEPTTSLNQCRMGHVKCVPYIFPKGHFKVIRTLYLRCIILVIIVNHGMGCTKEHLKLVPGTTLLVVGFVLIVVGLASAHWCHSADTFVNIGLWEICFLVKVSEVQCFEFRERDYTPIIIFITSALCVIAAIFDFVAVLWGIAAIFQKKRRAFRWTQKAGIMAALADVLLVIAVCLYAASYKTIQYQKIPRWSTDTVVSLAWSFYVTCGAAAILLLGATYSIAMALQSSSVSTVHVTPMTAHSPSPLMHPPPSSRIPSPFRLRPRAPSPLPFSRAAFQTPRMNHSPILPS